MKKRLAAAALAVLIGFVFLFAQGPVQKVRLWDTNLSHSLLFQWNEDDVAGRTLNFLVDGASRSLSIFGDTWVEQDYRIAATPTFAGLYLQSSTAAPFLKLTNASDTERDPIHQMAAGSTPLVKWTWGLDDSEDDNWKLANATALGTTTTISYRFGDILYYVNGDEDSIVGVELGDFTTDMIYVTGGHGSADGEFDQPKQIAYSGTHIYVADDLNDRIQKFLASDGSFVSHTTEKAIRPWGCTYWNGYIYISSNSGGGGLSGDNINKFDAETLVFQATFGSWGTGNNNFKGARSITTDGTYLYICDTDNSRIKKHTLSGTYVAQIGSYGTGNGQFILPSGIATNGTYVYVCDSTNKRIQILNCIDLTYVTQVAMETRDAVVAAPRSITLNGTHYYVGVGAGNSPHVGYIAKYDIATNTFEAFYDTSGGLGGDPDYIWGSIILKDEVSHGDLIVIHEDGQFIDLYSKTRFFDSIRLFEGVLATGEYVGLRAPTDVTASYHLTLPAATNAAKSHIYAAAGGVLGWGQNVDTDGSPIFANITDSGLTATHPVFTDGSKVLVSTGTVPVDHGGTGLASYAIGDLLYASAGTTLAKLADVAVGSYIASGGVGAAPVWANISAFEPALGNPGTDGWVLSSTILGVRSWIAPGGGGGADHFVDLLDVPAAYAGSGGYVVKVKGDASGLEFVAGGAGVASFNDLDDVPASYVGQAGLFAKVKATEDGLEFAAGSAGAPTDAKYIVGLANGTLSAERVKQALYTNYDIDDTPAAPNAMDDEFDDSSLDVKWTLVNNPAGANAISETAFPGMIYVGLVEQATPEYEANLIIAYQAAPAGNGDAAMTWVCKISVANVGDSCAAYGQWAGGGVIIWNPTNHEYLICADALRSASSCFSCANGLKNGAAPNYSITALTSNYILDAPQSQWLYLKLEKVTTDVWTASNTYNFYASTNGITWTMVGKETKTFTTNPSRIGLSFRGVTATTGAAKGDCVVDFFRRTI